MDVIHSPLEENITNLQPSYRQHISRAVLEAVCFQVMLSSKNIVRVLSILIWISLEIFFKLGRYKNKNIRLLRFSEPWWPTLVVNPSSFSSMEVCTLLLSPNLDFL